MRSVVDAVGSDALDILLAVDSHPCKEFCLVFLVVHSVVLTDFLFCL